ncbi:MAG: hypothetical protein WKG07_38145 [Hymenobacter sp.]
MKLNFDSMKNILTLALVLVAIACSSPITPAGEAAATPSGGPRPYVTGVLPLDPATMMYQQNNVGGPPTTLFSPPLRPYLQLQPRLRPAAARPRARH